MPTALPVAPSKQAPLKVTLPPVPRKAASSGRTTMATGTITGAGTIGTIPKFTGTNAIGNSILIEKSGRVGIGTTSPPGTFSVVGTVSTPYSIYASNSGAGGSGVYGFHSSSSGDTAGVTGETASNSASAAGLRGTAKAASGGATSAGVRGLNLSTSANGFGVYGTHSGIGVGVYGNSAKGIGVRGSHTATTGTVPGVLGETNSTNDEAVGVQGIINSTSAGNLSAGVRGINNGNASDGAGVWGSHAGVGGTGVYGTAPDGFGVMGDSANGTALYGTSSKSIGVRGRHGDTTGTTPGVLGETNSTSDYASGVQGVVNSTSPGLLSAGVLGINNGAGDSAAGVYGYQAGTGYGVYGNSPQGYGIFGATESGFGVFGKGNSGTGVNGTSTSKYGVSGTSTNSRGVYGYSLNAEGVYGSSGSSGKGVYGKSLNGDGVYGTSQSDSGYGVHGFASGGVGVYGEASTGTGVYGKSNGSADAGYFSGNVKITGDLSVGGTLSKLAGSFKIDHPLHPATEYLSHSFVESPDMMNVYNGNTTLDRRGQATITLPAYFQALNRDFRYQLTPIGAPAMLYVAQKISGNQFKIAGGKAGLEVSWQVTGIRNDAYARQHRIQVEENKTGDDQGKYLYPAGFGAGNDKRIGHNAPRLAAR